MPVQDNDSTLILTPSEAITRALRSEHAIAQRRLGNSAWETPQIYSLQRWCRDQWLQTWPSGQLLHPVHEIALWMQVIGEDDAARDVLAQSALARQARAASHTLVQYGIALDRGPRYTDEHHAFARWHRRVQQELLERDWVREVDIPARVTSLLRAGQIVPPSGVRFFGSYRAPTATEGALLETLRATGAEITVESPPVPRATLQARVYEDDTQQIQGLAAELRKLLQPSMEKDAPPRILVACSDVDSRRDLIESSLRPVLAPWLVLPGEGMRPLPWRFADGRSLEDTPLVAVALAICGLSLHENRIDEVSRVLLAGALWTPEERAITAAADYRLRHEGGNRFSLSAITAHLRSPLRQQFDSLLGAMKTMPARALPSAWVLHFEQRLNHARWPGSRSLPSAEFQARERWTESLLRLSAMDGQLGRIDHGKALFWLREIVSNRGFEPRADSEQPVEILSLSQAAGLPADHLFILDATDGNLPGPPQRQPFIAIETLKAAGVPAVTPTLALEDAGQLAGHLRGTVSEITLSYAATDPRGAGRTPTTVFGTELEWTPSACKQALTAAQRRTVMGPLLVTPESDPVPPVQDPVAEGIGGGVGIFKNFVDAPFFAFCIHRLGIETLPEPVPGMTPMAQGSVIHDVLESVWRELRSQQALKALDDTSLGKLADAPLDLAMTQHMPADRYGRRLRAIERARLRDVLLQWLRHEKRRSEGFEAIEFELKVKLNVEKLDMGLRIDRIDRVFSPAGERLLIIDYKTGRTVDIGGWDVDELSEPQLPLYASGAALEAAGIARVDGIAFAHVRDGHPALAAVTNWRLRLLDEEKSKHIENWEAQLSSWRERLTAIAQGFLRGDASIDLTKSRDRGFNADLLDLVRED